VYWRKRPPGWIAALFFGDDFADEGPDERRGGGDVQGFAEHVFWFVEEGFVFGVALSRLKWVIVRGAIRFLGMESVGIFAAAKMAHLCDDKTVAKVGHPSVVTTSEVAHPPAIAEAKV